MTSPPAARYATTRSGSRGTLRTATRPVWRRRFLAAAESALQWTGAAPCWARATGAAGATVLTYHAVTTDADEDWIDPSNALPAPEFAEHVRFLARRRTVVPMTALVQALRRGETPPRRTVALTFDDGYLNTLETAAPILGRWSLPAILYLPTGCVTRGETPWIDHLHTAFRFRTRADLALAEFGLGDLRSGTSDDAGRAYASIRDRLVVSSPEDRSRILDAVVRQLAPSAAPPRLAMTWDEVRALRRLHPRFEVGVHSVDHVDLTSCGPAEARRQIAACADDVERELGERPRHFSCPYNRTSHAVRELVAAAGYESAVSQAPPSLLAAGSDLHRIGRIDGRRSVTSLALCTGGAWPTLPRLLFGRTSA